MTRVAATDLGVVRAALSAWPDRLDDEDASNLGPSTVRLLAAMRAAVETPEGVGPADLAVLVRQVLRAEDEAYGVPVRVRVPVDPPWPDVPTWRRHGFDVLRPAGSGRVEVEAQDWRPTWLSTTTDPAAAAFRGFQSPDDREPSDLPADGFFRAATGKTRFRSLGQREAVRWLFAAPEGATLVANLPTGSGKSAVGYLLALTASRGTTVFVVPTTSLALDQARAFGTLARERPVGATPLPPELAYHAELDDDVKRSIRARIADGSQRIVFVSPEAVSFGLAPALFRAAEGGVLTGFVIDEAHVVAQWGAEFRPAFQSIAGLREELMTTCRDHGHPLPRTALMSATLTQDSLDTLGVLFGRPGPMAVVSAAALRHEPSYWVDVADGDTRHARLVEALRHLPRPAIVYTTLVDDARRLREELADLGWRRSQVVTGKSTAEHRRAAIERLRDRSLDLVIATSAFGLGVDQPDVRTVIHACVPETIDRWYQEVGRGGRDGRPSVALLLATENDLAVARDLSRRKIISIERGRERWAAMRNAADALGGGRMRVPLNAIPPDLDQDSSRNRAWNLRTLLLLHRSHALALEAQPPPRRAPDEPEDAWEARAAEAFDEHAATAIVRVLKPIDDDAIWDGAVVGARLAAATADRATHEAIMAAIEPGAELCTLLQHTYVVSEPIPGVEVPLPITVAASCGGCPACRAAGRPPRRLVPPAPQARIGGNHQRWTLDALVERTARDPLIVLADPRDRDGAVRAIERLAQRGLWVLDPGELEDRFGDLHQSAISGAIFTELGWTPWGTPDLPTAVIRLQRPVERHVLERGGPPRVVIVGRDAIDPRHGAETVALYHRDVMTLDHLLQEF